MFMYHAAEIDPKRLDCEAETIENHIAHSPAELEREKQTPPELNLKWVNNLHCLFCCVDSKMFPLHLTACFPSLW